MLSVIQIEWFLNQLFLQTKSMKQAHFLHVDTKSQKLIVDRKFFVCSWTRMGEANMVCDSKIISQEWTDGINWPFSCWYNFTKIKMWLKNFGVKMVKNGCGQSGGRTLKLTLSEEWANEINWFFACWYMITKIKSWSKNLWVGICQKWVWPVWSQDSKIDCISKMNRWNKIIFSCWYKFRKAESWFNDFWMGVVKNGHCFLFQETLISAVS